MDGVLNGRSSPGRTQAVQVRAASSKGPAKAKLFLEDMIRIGEDSYIRRNDRLTKIMQLPPGNRRKATYAGLQGDPPFCAPA